MEPVSADALGDLRDESAAPGYVTRHGFGYSVFEHDEAGIHSELTVFVATDDAVKFSRLKLHGFKSFCDHTELFMEPGLTGVVGPNGCGKSNLVEALRWVMGETSAKQMRGGEMDDVIFNGTEERAVRLRHDHHDVLIPGAAAGRCPGGSAGRARVTP